MTETQKVKNHVDELIDEIHRLSREVEELKEENKKLRDVLISSSKSLVNFIAEMEVKNALNQNL